MNRYFRTGNDVIMFVATSVIDRGTPQADAVAVDTSKLTVFVLADILHAVNYHRVL